MAQVGLDTLLQVRAGHNYHQKVAADCSYIRAGHASQGFFFWTKPVFHHKALLQVKDRLKSSSDSSPGQS
jgi:hypothetical protein